MNERDKLDQISLNFRKQRYDVITEKINETLESKEELEDILEWDVGIDGKSKKEIQDISQV